MRGSEAPEMSAIRNRIRTSGCAQILHAGWRIHLGLDVHDVGFASEPVQPVVLLTCEPAIYVARGFWYSFGE